MTSKVNTKQRMERLVEAFPAAAKAAGGAPWDAEALDQWAAETPCSHGELVTARFLLAVWDPARSWGCGQFDVMEALRVWDDRHHAAFLAWAVAPWWP